MSIASVFISIFLLIYLAYRGVSVLILAPLMAVFTVLLSGGEALLAHYTEIFMVKLGDFVTIYFPLFLLSAIFGKIMENSGCACSIANYISKKIGYHNSILAVIISCSILTYGGISLFVVAFAVYPIAVELFRKSHIPKRLIPGSVAVGAFTYTMVALPGTPAIQNAIPSQYFGTNTFAAPGLSIIASILMFAMGLAWMKYAEKTTRAKGEGYGAYDDKIMTTSSENLPNFWLAVTPIAIVIIVNYICVKYAFPNMDVSYLKEEKYGSIDIEMVASNWAIIVSLFFSIVFLIATNFKRLNIVECLNIGATQSLGPVFNTASVVGYGAVVNCIPGFILIRDWVLSHSLDNPIISGAFITGLFSGITGSASGGMTIMLEGMGAKYLEMVNAIGMNPEIIHRIIAFAGSFGTLPHCGAVITLLATCGLSHKESYRDIFITAVLVPIIAMVITILLNNLFGTF